MRYVLAALALFMLINSRWIEGAEPVEKIATPKHRYEIALQSTRDMLAESALQVQLWTTSGELIRSANEAATSGDFETAMAHLDEARLHAELALATAVREKTAWLERVPK